MRGANVIYELIMISHGIQKRTHRLHRRDDFTVLFTRGTRIDNPLFRVVVKKNPYGFSRYAFISPRAVDKRAVIRNRLRRRAREWFRKNMSLHRAGLDIAVVFKKNASDVRRNVLYEELKKITDRIIDL